MIVPGREVFFRDRKKFRYVPLSLRWMADLDTPISLCLKLKAHCLLESVEKGDSMGRYSIMATEKKTLFSIKGQEVTITDYHQDKPISSYTTTEKNPLEILIRWREENTCADYEDLPPYQGGLVGYLGHETIHSYEPTVPIYSHGGPKDALNIPDGILYFHKIVIVYDNVKKEAVLIKLCGPFNQNGEIEGGSFDYDHEVKCLQEIQKRLISLNIPLSMTVDRPQESSKITSNLTQQEYQDKVNQTIRYLEQGEAIQVVISQRFETDTTIPAFEIYRTLKTRNPSPYLYYFDFGNFQMIGCSPEVMVKVQGNELLLKPIAGTRPRGMTLKEDEKLSSELLADEKEIAEHLMLVDLGRNDLSRVAETGTVKVSDYMTIEKFSQVQHIASTIEAMKNPDCDALEVLQATFPAGTLSGAPKIRALQIIHELEEERRNTYGGVVLHYALNGDLNSCITIRTIILKDEKAHIQAGAGIVLDSVPEHEYQETVNKARAMIDAINLTQERMNQGFKER